MSSTKGGGRVRALRKGPGLARRRGGVGQGSCRACVTESRWCSNRVQRRRSDCVSTAAVQRRCVAAFRVRSRRVMPLARREGRGATKARQPCFGRNALSFQEQRCHLSQRAVEECGTVEQHAEADKPRVVRWARLAA